MGSTAWNTDGDVTVKNEVPWGAVRKALLHYKGATRALAKIIVAGVAYNIGQQATEGLVVVGNGYSCVTFFLPDSREPMRARDGATMSILDYLTMLGQSEYAEIRAWDYFAQFVNETLSDFAQETSLLSEAAGTTVPYSISPAVGSEVAFSGTGAFTEVTTAKEFFAAIATTVDAAAKNSPLGVWMLEDRAVSIVMTIQNGETPLTFPMIVGRK